jgi:CRISPR/Cas system-associated endoribonuclease Cas2
MANKKFTANEMERLQESPYVLDVSPSIVHFSAGFKKLFYEALQGGKSPNDIVLALGIDPNILGENRVMGLRTMICNEVRAGKGFRDLNTYGKYLDCALSPEAKIHLLEQELAYKNQEIEFLKKITSLGGG